MRKTTSSYWLNFLFILLFSHSITTTSAQSDSTEIANYQFSHLYGQQSGLPDNWIWKVFQDSRGFTWIGTHDGLLRWDGLTFHLYIPNDKDSTALLGASIVDILEDKDGYIWLASHNKGIARFDHQTETFKNFRHKSLLKGVIAMKQDSKGIFWLGSFGNGLFRYDPEIDSLKAYPIQTKYAKGETAFRFNSVKDVMEDVADDNILWIGGNNGLFKFDKKKATFQRFASTAPKTSLMAINAVRLDPDNPDKLWLAGHGGGMIHFNIPSSTWKYHVYDEANFINYDGYKNVIVGLARKSEDEFWIHTKNNSGGVFNTKTKTFTFFKHQYNDPTSISWGEGWSINKDKDGRIWFGFKNRGLSYINPDCQAFYSLPLNMGDCRQHSANNITDFGLDATENKIYAVANSCDGLYEINPHLKTHKVIPTLGFETDYQIYSTVLVTRKGKVWVGGRDGKGGEEDNFKRPTLLYLDKAIGKLRPFAHPMINGSAIQENNVIDFYEDEQENLWVASDNGQLYELNFATNEIHTYSLDKWKGKKPIVEIAQIIDHKNGLWIGTSHGIFNFDFTTHNFEQLKGTAPFRVSSLAQDTSGIIWFGTKEEGLKMINPLLPNQIINPDIENLPRTPIDKIIIDQNNHPWLSAQKGIYFLDKTINYFQNYNENDGLNFNRFYQHGFYQLPNGNMLLGQDDGYYHIQPECLTQPQVIDTVFISEFNVSNKIFKQPPNKLSSVELAHQENFIGIEFSAQSYCQADKIRFTYRLEGMNQNWETTKQGRPFTKYTDVQPGNYTFKVHRTGFPETLRKIDILIHEPWWNTWFAWAAYTAIFLFAFKRYQKNQLDKQLLQKESHQLKDWNDKQTKLYANITHEFRTPLTIVMGLASQIEQETLDTKVAHKAANIQQNGQRFLSLINQILDLEKAKEGKIKLNIVQKEVKSLLEYTYQNLQPLAANKQIELVYKTDFDSLVMDHDSDKLMTILSNLLANAIKFTPNEGTIYYRAKKQGNDLCLEIEDTGIGIDPEFQKRIFERYFNLDLHTGKSGTGIGLALTNELVQLMGGRIEIDSLKGKGSTFRVILPITNNAPISGMDMLKSTKNGLVNPSGKITLSSPSKIDTNKPIVLIIEDNLEIANLVGTTLSKQYQIQFAKDGQEGIEKAIELVPDLIISDVMMPRKDGYEVCEILKLQELTSHIPIILLTAKTAQKDKIIGLKTGADDYLTKPFHPEELFLRVNNAIKSRSFLKERYGSLETFKEQPKLESPIEGIDLDMQDAFVKKLLYFLDKYFHDASYDVASLCIHLETSNTQLYRKIKALTDISSGKLIRLYRLNRAKQFLITTDKNISEIAFETGFKEPSTFSRAFKETFKLTPRDFRDNGVGT